MKIILKYVIEEHGMRICTGFIWHRIESSGRLTCYIKGDILLD
jgi:hypothetical protein